MTPVGPQRTQRPRAYCYQLGSHTVATIGMAFPTRGYYVVEAQFGNENGGFPNTAHPTGGWWRLGNAVVNDSGVTGSIDFPGANPSTPPSVNAGTPLNAVATGTDNGGAIQVIEWDADGNGTFERGAYTVPVNSGGNVVHPGLRAADLTQALSTGVPGLLRVNARITDNGAIDAADDIRRQHVVSGQVRVNAVPTAGDVSAVTDENTATTIVPAGHDADAQPQPLAYDIVTAPPASAGSVQATGGDTVTFTPAPDFTGTTSFTYRARDGGPDTVAAHAESNTATVTITVVETNDPPTATADRFDMAQAQRHQVQAPGVLANDTDVDGDPLTAVLVTGTSHGSLSLSPNGSFSYTPDPGFRGADSFTYQAHDRTTTSTAATVTLDVAPMLSVSDATPVSERRSGRGIVDAVFLVSLSAPASTPIRVSASTMDGTALAGGDYAQATMTLEFEPGQTQRTVRIRIFTDPQTEPEEQFFLVLTTPNGAAILDGHAAGTIRAS